MKMDKLKILWRANLHCLEAESGISKKFLYHFIKSKPCFANWDKAGKLTLESQC